MCTTPDGTPGSWCRSCGVARRSDRQKSRRRRVTYPQRWSPRRTPACEDGEQLSPIELRASTGITNITPWENRNRRGPRAVEETRRASQQVGASLRANIARRGHHKRSIIDVSTRRKTPVSFLGLSGPRRITVFPW